MDTIRRMSIGAWWVVTGLGIGLLLADWDAPPIAAQGDLPTLHHSGRHYWLKLSQAEAIGRAYAAVEALGLPLDDGGRTKWVCVGRKPGLYVGVVAYADGPDDRTSGIDDNATRVHVGITVVYLAERRDEAHRAKEFIDAYIRTGRAPSDSNAAPPRPDTSQAAERIWTVQPVYKPGENPTVGWANTPGQKGDGFWISRDTWTLGTGMFVSTDGARNGEKLIADAAYNGMAAEGRYIIRLIHGDAPREVVASCVYTVEK